MTFTYCRDFTQVTWKSSVSDSNGLVITSNSDRSIRGICTEA